MNARTNAAVLIILVVVVLFYYAPQYTPYIKGLINPTSPVVTQQITPADPTAPVIYSVFPTSATFGDTIEVKGKNLAGFEGDRNLWIESRELGIKGIIYGSADSSSSTIHFTLANKYCTEDTSYSGKDCDAYFNLSASIYYLYALPWGKKSNAVNFEIR
jgi:hypothetical protein